MKIFQRKGHSAEKKLDDTLEILNCVYITFKVKELVECCHFPLHFKINIFLNV